MINFDADVLEVLNEMSARLLVLIDSVSYLANLAFVTVVIAGVILTLMLFYTLLKRFL